MKSSSTSRLLLLSGAFLFASILILSAFSHNKTSRLVPGPTEPTAFATDDDYYKIPNGATFNGQAVTNKASLLTLSTELGHNYYLVNDTVNNTGFLYTEVKADNYVPTEKVRSPLNIALVIDRSGSMQGDKLAYVKKAADFLIDKMDEKDLLSIVIYETQVGVLQRSVPVTDKAYLHELIKNIVVAGGTNLGGGMQEGYDQLKNSYKSGYVNRVLLLSDGLANEGITNTAQLQGIAKKWFNSESISISTFGVGNDYNENLMTTLAENGGGNYYYIKEPSQIPGIFQKEINGLLTLVARQASVTFSLPPQLIIQRVYGGNYEMDKNLMTVNMKDIFANETKAILIKYKIKPGSSSDIPISTHLEFQDATNSDKRQSVSNLNIIKPITDPKVYFANFSERVMQQCTMFESNDQLEKAMKAIDERQYDKARTFAISSNAYMANNKSKVKATPELMRQDSVMINYNDEIKDVERKTLEEVKVMQKSSKSVNYEIRKKK